MPKLTYSKGIHDSGYTSASRFIRLVNHPVAVRQNVCTNFVIAAHGVTKHVLECSLFTALACKV